MILIISVSGVPTLCSWIWGWQYCCSHVLPNLHVISYRKNTTYSYFSLGFFQHPKDCNKAKKLVCNLNKGCGYGCQIHHLVYCFIIAYGTERTLILDSRGWRYSASGWEKVFKPLSDTCQDRKGKSSRSWGRKLELLHNLCFYWN